MYKQLVEATIQPSSSVAEYFDFDKLVLTGEDDFLIEVANALACVNDPACEIYNCVEASLDSDKVSFFLQIID